MTTLFVTRAGIAVVVSATGSIRSVRPFGGGRRQQEDDHMAKSKGDLLADAQAAGLVASDASEDDYTVDDLRDVLNPDRPMHRGSLSASEPIVAPDGHVVLSQADIDARDAG
jgi:hypothetical protein